MRAPIILAAIVTLTATSAHAAEFAKEELSDGRIALHMHGIIERGDEVKIIDAQRGKPTPVLFFLDSPGGDLFASLEIGRHNNLPTQVRSGEKCASGCAMIWASGRERYIETGASVGFHGASKTIDGCEVEVGWANAEVGAYYARLGFSDAAIYRMTGTPPTGMHWIDAIDVGNGIAFAPRLPTSAHPITSEPMQLSGSIDPAIAVAATLREMKPLPKPPEIKPLPKPRPATASAFPKGGFSPLGPDTTNE